MGKKTPNNNSCYELWTHILPLCLLKILGTFKEKEKMSMKQNLNFYFYRLSFPEQVFFSQIWKFTSERSSFKQYFQKKRLLKGQIDWFLQLINIVFDCVWQNF